MHDLLTSHDASRQTDIAILDFSKAFDTVPHKRLLHKLDHYGIKGPVHTWITNFLTQRRMRVVLEGEESKEVPVESGVPQGTVLGPLLFLCHINDLPESVKSTVRLFADDCLVYREIRTFQDQLALQADLDRLVEWANNWGMKFNAQKCYILSTKNKFSFFYNLDGTILKHVQHHPYLGVQISSDLKWSTHISQICKKAGSTLGFLRRNLRNCPQECRRTAFIALVRATLEYGAVVWDPYLKQDVERLERIQRQAARFITKDYRSREAGCVTKMLQDHKLPSLANRRKQRRLTMLYKIMEGMVPAIPPDQFLKQAKKRRTVKPTTFSGFDATNIMERQVINNTRGLNPPASNTESFRHSYFVQTPLEWNVLSEDTVRSATVGAFTSAVGRSLDCNTD